MSFYFLFNLAHADFLFSGGQFCLHSRFSSTDSHLDGVSCLSSVPPLLLRLLFFSQVIPRSCSFLGFIPPQCGVSGGCANSFQLGSALPAPLAGSRHCIARKEDTTTLRTSGLHLQVTAKPAVWESSVDWDACQFTILTILASRTLQFLVPAQTSSTSLSGGEFYLPEISVFIPFPVAVNRYRQKNAAQRGGGAHSLGVQPVVERKRGVAMSGSVVRGIFDVCLFTS